MAFTFLPGQPVTGEIPDETYSVSTATQFEAGSQLAGITWGSKLRAKNLIDRSPQQNDSLWVVTRFRPDLDQFTIVPTGSRAICSSRTYSLEQLLDQFIVLNLNNTDQGLRC